MEKKPIYQEVLEIILKSLVNNPNDVQIQRTLDEMGVLLTIKVHPQDMGIIIGHRGETIKAIRNIIKTIGNRHFARVNIRLTEPSALDKAKAENISQSDLTMTGDKIIEELKSELQQKQE